MPSGKRPRLPTPTPFESSELTSSSSRQEEENDPVNNFTLDPIPYINQLPPIEGGRTELIDLSSRESLPIQNHPINTTLDTTLALLIPPSALGQTKPTQGNIVSPLAPRALVFSTPTNSPIEPHPYLASLDDLPPRSLNPQPRSHSQDGRFSPVALASSIEVIEPPRTGLQYWPVLLRLAGSIKAMEPVEPSYSKFLAYKYQAIPLVLAKMVAPLPLLEKLVRVAESDATKDQLIVLFEREVAGKIRDFRRLSSEFKEAIRRRDAYVDELRASRSCDDALGTIKMLSRMQLVDIEKAARLMLMARET
nr:hypothetical protein [Tanacetum cinerariifolium]